MHYLRQVLVAVPILCVGTAAGIAAQSSTLQPTVRDLRVFRPIGQPVLAPQLLAAVAPHRQAADTVRIGSTHSPLAAGLLEMVFPTAGFAYAGDWTRGFLPNAFRFGALIGFAARSDGPSSDVCEGDGACQVLAAAVLATTIWAIVDAVQTAHDYNAMLVPREAGLFVEPSLDGGLLVGFRLNQLF